MWPVRLLLVILVLAGLAAAGWLLRYAARERREHGRPLFGIDGRPTRASTAEIPTLVILLVLSAAALVCVALLVGRLGCIFT